MVKRKNSNSADNDDVVPMPSGIATALTERPQPPVDWTRCHAYNNHKKRFCRQLKHSCSKEYCGNHLHLQGNERKRVKCPIDPSHYIFADSLDKHLKKCPKKVEQEQLAEKQFYRHDCNCGGHGELFRSSPRPHTTIDLESAQRLALRILHVHQATFHHQQAERDDKLLSSAEDHCLLSLQEPDICAALPMADLSKPELDAGLSTATADYRIKTGGARHLHQQASMVGHLRRIGALESLDDNAAGADAAKSTSVRRILEMGAGRGMLGLVVAGVSAIHRPTHLTMIERGSSRSRAEKSLRKAKAFPEHFSSSSQLLNITGVDFDRIKCDLAHLDMCTVCTNEKKTTVATPVTSVTDTDTSNAVAFAGQDEEIIVLAKHLCGVGTDLALKSLEPIKEKVSCCIMSTCCHGVCNWRDYVGRSYLMKLMIHDIKLPCFEEKEFDLMRIWSSGTVWDGDVEAGYNQRDDGEEEHNKPTWSDNKDRNVASITQTLRLQCGPQGLGRACQRLIDFGRQEYLRNVIFSDAKDNSQMLYYVPAEVTPQNALLIAHR